MERNIKLLALFNFFTDLKFYGAVLIIYFAQVTGSYLLGMSLFSLTFVSAALFELPTGIYSDRVGRRKTLILGALSSVISVALYALGKGYWTLSVGAVFEGLSRSWYSGNNDALLHDTISSLDKRVTFDELLGKTSAMFQAALIVSAAIGGILAQWSFPLVMWLSVVPQILCLFLATQVAEPSVTSKVSGNIYDHLKDAWRIFFINRKVRLLSLNDILHSAIGESTYQLRAAFINMLWPLWAVGVAKMLSNIGAAISYWYSGKLIRKFGAAQLLLFKDVYNRTVNIVATAFPTLVSPLLLATNSLMYGPSEVGTKKLFHEEFSDTHRATMWSLNSLVGSLFFGICSLLIGYLADIFDPARAILIAQIILAPTLFLSWSLVKIELKRH